MSIGERIKKWLQPTPRKVYHYHVKITTTSGMELKLKIQQQGKNQNQAHTTAITALHTELSNAKIQLTHYGTTDKYSK